MDGVSLPAPARWLPNFFVLLHCATPTIKAYLVLRGRGKGDDVQAMTKPQAAKFLAKSKNSSHNATSSRGSNRDLDIPGLHTISDPEIQVSIAHDTL